jgi:peptidoglycan pentaglycine glycine transferase (the first glycine)
MQVSEITNKSVWENFMAQINPHTFLQSWNWGLAQEKMGNQIIRLGIYDADQLMGLALLLVTKAKRGKFLLCPHGPIFSDTKKVPAILEALTRDLKERAEKLKCSFIRISPLMAKNDANQKLFKNLGFREAPVHLVHPELSWMLKVEDDEEELLRGMRKTTRYCIRKSKREEIKVKISANHSDTDLFWQIYKNTADRHKFVPFPKNYLKIEFETFMDDDQACYFFALHKNRPIAASMVIFYGDSAFYHHGASIHKYKNLTTTSYLLQWEAIKEAKRRGLKLYNFWGIVDTRDTSHPWAGISLFKRGFGGFAESYLHAKDLIISPAYWITYIIETVRKIKRGYN